ncbi:MAG: (2Fe-2S)-binding protein [Phycisphaerales bacterium]|nr:(2Fe-2S)-binding protein [Phycisphaerales bacterium]
MQLDDEVCLCFHVSQRKILAHLEHERPKCASQLSECFSAGTGCHWCVPFLTELHRRWSSGESMELIDSPADYAQRRQAYKAARKQAAEAVALRGPLVQSGPDTPPRVDPETESQYDQGDE